MSEEEGPSYGISDHQADYANVAEEESYQSPGPVGDPLAPRLPPSFSSPSVACPITSMLPVSARRRTRCPIPLHPSSGTSGALRRCRCHPFFLLFALLRSTSASHSIFPFEVILLPFAVVLSSCSLRCFLKKVLKFRTFSVFACNKQKKRKKRKEKEQKQKGKGKKRNLP